MRLHHAITMHGLRTAANHSAAHQNYPLIAGAPIRPWASERQHAAPQAASVRRKCQAKRTDERKSLYPHHGAFQRGPLKRWA